MHKNWESFGHPLTLKDNRKNADRINSDELEAAINAIRDGLEAELKSSVN